MAGVSKGKVCACGVIFDRPKRLSNSQWQSRAFCSKKCAGLRRSASALDICAAYSAGKSSVEISASAEVSPTQIRRIIKSAGLSIRSSSEAMALSHARPETKAKLSEAALGRSHTDSAKEKLRAVFGPAHPLWRGGITTTAQGYVAFTASKENLDNAGRCQHCVIAEKYLGGPIPEGSVVHHRDRDKRNNTPSNLQILTASEHAKLHFEAGEFRRKKHA